MGLSLENIGTGIKMDPLWERTEKQFVSTIVLNSSPKYILIEAAGSINENGDPYNFNPVQMFDTSLPTGYLYGLADAHTLRFRLFSIQKEGSSITLTFGYGNADSTHLIPTKVYGISF